MSVTNINIPTTQSFLLIDTRTGPNKVLFLPAASTIQGRYLSFKDYYGNATASTVTISTSGLDRIDQRGIRYTLASSFGSVMLLSDGLRSWNMMGLYEGGDTAIGMVALPGGTVTATGGTTTTSGSYKIHTFTTSGTFTITSPSLVSVTYLVVAGGGGGGVGRGGGGGGGGVLTGTTTLSAGSFTITVGAGGANAYNDLQGGDGGSSSIGTTVVTTGGGGGGGWITNTGRNGGSGGGASAGSAASAGTGIAGQGYAGSARLDTLTGGGGGGAGAAASGKDGAIGISSQITGTTTYYAGGGGAGALLAGGSPGVAYGGTYQVANGTYGGGNGANTGGSGVHQPYQDAVANTGGGGGGQEGYQGNSGAGGSGIVIISYIIIAAPTLTVLPDVRYSFLSTNYSSGSVNNIGTATSYGVASISGGTYTSTNPGYITFAWGTGYIQAPSITSIKTIIMIVRLTNTSAWSYLLDARNGLGSGYWATEIGGDWVNNSTYYKDTVLTTTVSLTSYQALGDSLWHHVCLVYPTGFTDDVTFMARISQNETVGGGCAEIMVFTVALTQQQIKDNFNYFASRFGWTTV